MDDFTAKWGFSRSAANREGRQASCAASEGTPEHREPQTALAEEEGCILRLQGCRCKHHRHKLSSVDVQVFPNGVCGGPLVASKDQRIGEVAPQKAYVWFFSMGLTERNMAVNQYSNRKLAGVSIKGLECRNSPKQAVWSPANWASLATLAVISSHSRVSV